MKWGLNFECIAKAIELNEHHYKVMENKSRLSERAFHCNYMIALLQCTLAFIHFRSWSCPIQCASLWTFSTENHITSGAHRAKHLLSIGAPLDWLQFCLRFYNLPQFINWISSHCAQLFVYIEMNRKIECIHFQYCEVGKTGQCNFFAIFDSFGIDCQQGLFLLVISSLFNKQSSRQHTCQV